MKREPETIRSEISRLQEKAKARRDRPGYAQNVAAIDAELARLNAELEAAESDGA